MSDLIEGMGTASEGGLFARVLEPESGARSAHPDQPGACLNCGTELVGAYCHACGQRAHIHRTIGAFMHDLLHGALHFEGKLWRTLPLLLVRPGQLTRRYIEGARARFVSPMALFLFSVFLMFAVFQVLGLSTPTNIERQMSEFERGMADGASENSASQPAEPTGTIDSAPRSPGSLAGAVTVLTDQRDQAQAALDALAADDPARAAAEAELAQAQEAIPLFEEIGKISLDNDGSARWTITSTGIDWIDTTLLEKWRENPSLMLYKLQANSYKFSWLLIPLSIPFVWLLFAWRRQFVAYDHAIFVTYSLSFMTLLFVMLSVLGVVGMSGGALLLVLLIVPPIHLYKQLRGSYALSRFSAFWRLLALSIFIWIIIVLFLQLLLLLGAF